MLLKGQGGEAENLPLAQQPHRLPGSPAVGKRLVYLLGTFMSRLT